MEKLAARKNEEKFRNKSNAVSEIDCFFRTKPRSIQLSGSNRLKSVIKRSIIQLIMKKYLCRRNFWNFFSFFSFLELDGLKYFFLSCRFSGCTAFCVSIFPFFCWIFRPICHRYHGDRWSKNTVWLYQSLITRQQLLLMKMFMKKWWNGKRFFLHKRIR